MIKRRNCSKAIGAKIANAYFDISATTAIDFWIADSEYDLRIESIDLVYIVATDAGTRPESLQVGNVASATTYANATPAASTAVGTVVRITPSSTAFIAKGDALHIKRSAAAGGTNTGEVMLVVKYSQVERRQIN